MKSFINGATLIRELKFWLVVFISTLYGFESLNPYLLLYQGDSVLFSFSMQNFPALLSRLIGDVFIYYQVVVFSEFRNMWFP